MAKNNQPSQIEIEREWVNLRENVERLERAGKRSEADKAFSELLLFESRHRHPGIDFADLHTRFNAKLTPNVAEIERRWMEYWRTGAVDDLAMLERRYPQLKLDQLEKNFEPAGNRSH